MALRITATSMTSDQTPHTATWDKAGGWVCSRVPGLLGRNAAITAMSLAEAEAAGQGGGPHAAGWRAELGLPAGDDGQGCALPAELRDPKPPHKGLYRLIPT